MTKSKIIKALQEEVSRINGCISVIQQIGELPSGAEYLNLSSLVIQVRTLDDLGILKGHLYKKLGWEGKLGLVWNSDDKMLAEWQDNRYDFSVWLNMPIKDFPDNLRPGCRVVELVPEVVRRYAYVCEASEKNNERGI